MSKTNILLQIKALCIQVTVIKSMSFYDRVHLFA